MQEAILKYTLANIAWAAALVTRPIWFDWPFLASFLPQQFSEAYCKSLSITSYISVIDERGNPSSLPACKGSVLSGTSPKPRTKLK